MSSATKTNDKIPTIVFSPSRKLNSSTIILPPLGIKTNTIEEPKNLPPKVIVPKNLPPKVIVPNVSAHKVLIPMKIPKTRQQKRSVVKKVSTISEHKINDVALPEPEKDVVQVEPEKDVVQVEPEKDVVLTANDVVLPANDVVQVERMYVEQQKHCPKCNIDKSRNDFITILSDGKQSLHIQCLSCRLEADKRNIEFRKNYYKNRRANLIQDEHNRQCQDCFKLKPLASYQNANGSTKKSCFECREIRRVRAMHKKYKPQK